MRTYLASRGLGFPSCVDVAGALRFHACCPFGKHRFPAMVALIRNAITGEPCGVHRTALRDDGTGKRIMPDNLSAKMMMGRTRDATVMLQSAASRMGIAEGIETALSAQKLFGVPIWAALSAGNIAEFPVIDGVKQLTVFADNDTAGMAAARECARRCHNAGIEGEIRCPQVKGTDWNDVHVERQK